MAPFIVKDGTGTPVTGLVTANFTIRLIRNNVVIADAVTISERLDIANGYYQATYVPSSYGVDELVISHPTYGVLQISMNTILQPQYGQPSIWENLP